MWSSQRLASQSQLADNKTHIQFQFKHVERKKHALRFFRDLLASHQVGLELVCPTH